MLQSQFSFENGRGETLSGRLEEPYDDCRGYALFAHCFTCSKDIAAATRVSRALVDRGIGVLRFDFTGLGNSEGDFANENFSSNVQDLLVAARALNEASKEVDLLIGHSLGGAAVLAAAPELKTVKAVVTIAAPASPGHVTHLLRDGLDEINARGEAEVDLAGRRFTIKKQFVDDLQDQRLEAQIRRIRRPLLVLHAPTDELVGVDEARKIFEAATHPKSFISLDDADHLLTRPRDSQYVADVVSAWASRFLPERRSQDEDEGLVRVSALPKLAQRVQARRHVLRGDEPKSLGGDDSGITPYEFLLAALGTCTSMTLRMYAKRKAWPLEEVDVLLRHERSHQEDAEGQSGRVERLHRQLRIQGPLDEAQRARLREIADRCPVHRTLEACPEIVTDMTSSEE
ncbi:MAG: bifunctional alpha/beta hydrolase/OsmC family protein [Myxococcota bacterium]